MTSVNLSKPVSEHDKNVQGTSNLHSKLLVITSLDGGSGDYTKKVTSIGGVGSARLHLRPMYRAAQELDLNPRLISLDIDHPSILGDLGNPDICVIGKVNHAMIRVGRIHYGCTCSCCALDGSQCADCINVLRSSCSTQLYSWSILQRFIGSL